MVKVGFTGTRATAQTGHYSSIPMGVVMPYKVLKTDKCPAGKPFAVVNTDTGKIHGCMETRAVAIKQMRLLYGIESGSINNK